MEQRIKVETGPFSGLLWVADKTPADDWNNLTSPAKHAGNEPIIEAYEGICVEGNGNHGQVVVSSK